MKRSELTEFAVEEEGFKLKICRAANGMPVVSGNYGSNHPFIPAEAPPSPAPAAASAQAQAAAKPADAKGEEGVTYIKSPMVGTFYRAASPDSKPFLPWEI